MAYQKILQYIGSMERKAAAGSLDGLDAFKIGQIAFSMDLPIGNDVAYGLFSKLSEACRAMPPEEAAAAAIIAAGYLVDARVGFRAWHPWDFRTSVKCNLLALRNARCLDRYSRGMRRDVQGNPHLRYLPILEAAVLPPAAERDKTT